MNIKKVNKLFGCRCMTEESIPKQGFMYVVDGIFIIGDGKSTIKQLVSKGCPKCGLKAHSKKEVKEVADSMDVKVDDKDSKDEIVEKIVKKDKKRASKKK